MPVSSIASTSALYTPALRPQAEAGETVRAGHDVRNDGDSDDSATAVKVPAATVNLNGQAIGTTINALA